MKKKINKIIKKKRLDPEPGKQNQEMRHPCLQVVAVLSVYQKGLRTLVGVGGEGGQTIGPPSCISKAFYVRLRNHQ